MRKSVVYSLALMSVLLVLTTPVSFASAADYTKVGVKANDMVVYKLSISAKTENKSIMLVSGINGTEVYLSYTNFFPNGTISSQSQQSTNVTTGSTLGWLSLIAANLTAGDPVYSGATTTINETVTMTTAGANRVVNHLYLSSGMLDIYWDKITGLMVKINFLFFGWLNYTMLYTTAWPPGAQPPTIDHPAIVNYNIGQTGNSITWHPSSQMPDHYTISVNGSSPTSYGWNGGTITYNVDGWSVGTYSVNCTVYDMAGRSISSTVTVKVQVTPSDYTPIIAGVGVAVVAIGVVGAVAYNLKKRK